MDSPFSESLNVGEKRRGTAGRSLLGRAQFFAPVLPRPGLENISIFKYDRALLNFFNIFPAKNFSKNVNFFGPCSAE